MSKPEELTLTIGAPAHGGHCIARTDEGQVVFVRHALPGETVKARITQKTSKIWRADAVEILKSSPDRVKPAWAQAGAGGVGGAELSHVSLPAQRTWKRWVLADCLRRIGGEDIAEQVGPIPVEPMPSETGKNATGLATRTRVELTITDDGVAGMHEPRSRRVQAVRSLPLAVEAIQDLNVLEGSRWKKVYKPGMRVSVVAPAGSEPLVMIDGQGYTPATKPTGRKRIDEIVDASALGLGELRYSVHADGFWQVHRQAPQELVNRVVRGALGLPLSSTEPVTVPSATDSSMDDIASSSQPAGVTHAGKDLKVLELFSGAGLFTLPLAMLGCKMTTMEGSEQAVRDARRNLHDFPNVGLHVGRVDASAVTKLGAGVDVIILDPPRTGVVKGVMDAIAQCNPKRVVMVACDPASLARDLKALVAQGYSVDDACALDMFPHTHHFETIVVASRR
ncbi:class I SAM-dependent RNA methyltransferase [Actinomyces vulturis]|uniref:class I SAM-dependent RNA methyltransferase n=1 Tax=Actinomyces vulturis TaxID=1857645 RepID=UPI00082D7EAF|nr:TRAM domain-containing protein [Actinomyces vulturis]